MNIKILYRLHEFLDHTLAIPNLHFTLHARLIHSASFAGFPLLQNVGYQEVKLYVTYTTVRQCLLLVQVLCSLL